MKTLAVVLWLVAGQSAAADIECNLTDVTCVADCPQTRVAFAIDPNQFVAPQDPNDPPRRKFTTVTLNEETFSPQAIALDNGIVGFHHDALNGVTTLMIVQPNDTALLNRQPQDQILAGQCTRT